MKVRTHRRNFSPRDLGHWFLQRELSDLSIYCTPTDSTVISLMLFHVCLRKNQQSVDEHLMYSLSMFEKGGFVRR